MTREELEAYCRKQRTPEEYAAILDPSSPSYDPMFSAITVYGMADAALFNGVETVSKDFIEKLLVRLKTLFEHLERGGAPPEHWTAKG